MASNYGLQTLKVVLRIGCSSICQVNRTQNVSKIRNLSIDHFKWRANAAWNTSIISKITLHCAKGWYPLTSVFYKNSFKIFTRHPSAERKQPKIKLNLFFQQVNSFSCIFLSSFSKFTGFYLIVYLLNSRSILEKTRWLIQS